MRRVAHAVGIAILSLGAILVSVGVQAAGSAAGAEADAGATRAIDPDRISLTVNDIAIADIMAVLARQGQVNIMLSEGVSGTVSINLYEVTIEEALHAIAAAGGFSVDKRGDTYFVLSGSAMILRSFTLQYADPIVVQTVLENHTSNDGKITVIPKSRILVVEDFPDYVARVAALLPDVDRKPQQLLIEARVLEITLDDTETYGIDWAKIFDFSEGTGALGTRGLSNPNSPGLFLEIFRPELEVALDAFRTRGRVRTLSTPSILTLENEEAAVVIGDRLGYRLTTTINQVTTESVEFLESGVILTVLPAIDESGRIRLQIHPEVSTGVVVDGLPNQQTTEVTTQLIVADGQTVFIGGLIRNTGTDARGGVPILGQIPLLGALFSSRDRSRASTETVVLITPFIVDPEQDTGARRVVDTRAKVDGVRQEEDALDRDVQRMEREVDQGPLSGFRASTPSAEESQQP